MAILPVGWSFRRNEGEHRITRLQEQHIDQMLESNIWHVRGSEADLVIDTGNGVGPLRPVLERRDSDRPIIAVATHGHFDHTGGLVEFDDRRCHEADAADVREPYPLALVRERFPEGLDELYAYYGYEAPDVLVTSVPRQGFDLAGWTVPGCEPTAFVDDGEVIDLGGRSIEVLHVPGHTPGSIALWEAATGALFTGDMVYADDRLSFEDWDATVSSLRRLRELPVTVVHPGHGRSLERDESVSLIDDLMVAGPTPDH